MLYNFNEFEVLKTITEMQDIFCEIYPKISLWCRTYIAMHWWPTFYVALYITVRIKFCVIDQIFVC